MADLTLRELQAAWWKWVDEDCPYSSAPARGKWMRSNVFSYDGTTWQRQTQSMQSNSGKATYTLAEVFIGADGRIVREISDVPLNRKNDPSRNWGLPE